ncbi:MAG TPA: hypothetical protein VFI70_06640, partial [Nitrososphaeraceae archaeon]|nr:hypothetical protein [Nitrososphaeraceae archaeon]
LLHGYLEVSSVFCLYYHHLELRRIKAKVHAVHEKSPVSKALLRTSFDIRRAHPLLPKISDNERSNPLTTIIPFGSRDHMAITTVEMRLTNFLASME